MSFFIAILYICLALACKRILILEERLSKLNKKTKPKKDYSTYTQDKDLNEELNKYTFTENFLYLKEEQIREILLDAWRYSIGRTENQLKYLALMKIIPTLKDNRLFEIRIVE